MTHLTTDSQLKNAGISVLALLSTRKCVDRPARSDFASPPAEPFANTYVRRREWLYWWKILIPSPRWDFPLCEDRYVPYPNAFSKHLQIRNHERGQQPWEVMSLPSTPWEKFAPRATRDSAHSGRCCPPSRVALPLSACEVHYESKQCLSRNASPRSALWAVTPPRTRWPPSQATTRGFVKPSTEPQIFK